jgi:predicted RecA/RadA family phage recombinase
MNSLYLEDDSQMIYQNSVAAKTAGTAVWQGGLLGILLTDVTETGTAPMKISGVYRYTKLSGGGTAWTIGAQVFFDATNARMTYANGVLCVPAGVAYAAAADGDTTGLVMINQKRASAVATNEATIISTAKAAGSMLPA